jgi:putative lipoprotein (rSAM/lipoprotein system)
MKIRILKMYNVLLAGLLSILGFASSCDPRDEYGTPSAKFIVNGKVSSTETGQAIENIQVVMKFDTSYTNTKGEYQVVDMQGFPNDQEYTIVFNDVDGTERGSFQDRDTLVEFTDPKFSGGDGNWYSGEISAKLDVQLSPKK